MGEPPIKILYLIPRDLYEKKMSRVRVSQWEFIAKHDRVRADISGPGWDNWDNKLSSVDNVHRIKVHGEDPNLVLTYKVGGLRGCHVPVAISYNEMNHQAEVREEIEDTGASLVIAHHWNDVAEYEDLRKQGITLFHIPHCADRRVYHDYGEPKTIDILCAGNMSQRMYPFRYRLMRLAVKTLKKRGWNVVVLPHPGYTLPAKAGTYVGEDFARMLNRAKVVFTDSMRFKYQLAKYSEIAMCRALPVGDMPDECPECVQRLERMILRVEPWQTDEDIVRIVEDVLDDPEELARCTKRAHQTAWEQCGMEHYAAQFVLVVKEFLLTRPKARKVLSPNVAPETSVICAWPEAVEHEATRALLTPDATYTVERIVQHKAPATVWLRELPGIKFPSTVFREAE